MKPLATAIASLGLLIAALPVALFAAGPADAQASDPTLTSASGTPTTGPAMPAAAPIGFGMDSASMSAQSKAGVAPNYATFWIGPWTLKSGWGGPDGQLAAMGAAGVTPAIHYYYWGDDISIDCVEKGCWSSLHNAQKTRAQWDLLGEQLIQHLHAKMGGKPVVIFLETEFNKGNVGNYEPLDAYLAAKAQRIKEGYPNAQIVMALGNWGSHLWGTWDRFAAASDYTGIQGMRGSTKQNLADYGTLYEGLKSGSDRLKSLFGKPYFITDIALSSYPEPDWLKPQADTLKEVFDHLPDLKANGLAAIIYRSWLDSPNMDLANYYGQAERHWGLAWASSAAQKPAAQVWIDGVKAERAGLTPAPPAPTAPAALPARAGTVTEVEAFASKSAGGRQADAASSGGAMWNLWSNGAVSQSYNASGPLEMTVRARGTALGGVAPHMDVTVGGVKVLSADPGPTYRDYTVAVPAGRAEVRIAFTNDARSATEDRNLVLDVVSFRGPNGAPVAAFSAAADGLTVRVDAAASSDPNGDALSFSWAFGDGATGTGATATHAYATAGTYTVTLTASDGKATSTANQMVTAAQPNRAPAAAFTATVAGLVASFDGSASSDPDGDALSYAWDFGDGGSGAGATATHPYAAGTYTATLTVSDGRTSASRSQAVTVQGPFTATFAVAAGSNQWWEEVKVTGSAPVAKVEYQANGGAWRPMALKAWGNWAANDYVAKGTPVAFRATDADGRTAVSEPQPWLGAALPPTTTTTTSAPAPTAFKATFAPKAVGNDWWIEAGVSGSKPVAKVEASLNGGSWTPLSKTSWGTYAKSLHAPNGTMVVFRATDASGATATSAPVTWK